MSTAEGNVVRRAHVLVLGACLTGIAVAEVADLLTPREVVFGSLVVAIVAVASLILPRTAVGVVLACAVLGRTIAAAVGTISPAVAALDCGVAAGVALAVLSTRGTRLAACATAYCPLKDRPIRVTWDSVELAPLPAVGDGRPIAISRPMCSLLSPRELQVMDLALRGLTARQIGEHLHLGERTVETYMARVYAKCRVSSRAELAELIVDNTTKKQTRPLA